MINSTHTTRMRTLYFGASLFSVLLSSSLLYAASEHVRGVTAITEVFGDGQKLSAVAIEYDTVIGTLGELFSSLFSVKVRRSPRSMPIAHLKKPTRSATGGT